VAYLYIFLGEIILVNQYLSDLINGIRIFAVFRIAIVNKKLRQSGDSKERLARAQARRLAQKPALEALLKRCEEKYATNPTRQMRIAKLPA
jgi:hypothetical protein